MTDASESKRCWYSCRFSGLYWIVLFLLLWILADTLAVVVPALQVVPEMDQFPSAD